MNIEDTFKYLIGGYYGISEMDNYPLKEFALKDVEIYITNFVKENYIKDYNYKEEAMQYKDKTSLKTKLQDSLIVLNKMNYNIELILLIKEKLLDLN